jgi:hypothetical protein
MMRLQNLLDITAPEGLNFISPFGLGDTMFLAVYKNVIESNYGLPVHLIIKPSHTVVMKMFARNDYSVYQFTESELRGIAKNNELPRPGMLYVAHPAYSGGNELIDEWNKQAYDVKTLWRRFLGLGESVPADVPVYYPPVSGKAPDPAGSALLLPEARSMRPLKRRYWEKIAASLRKEGLTVVQNYVDPDFCIKGVPRLSGDLYAVIGFALACKKVYSLRSGLCDLIAGKVKDLTVFYPDEFTYRVFPLDRAFSGQRLSVVPVAAEQKPRKNHDVKNFMKRLITKSPPARLLQHKFDAVEKRLEEKLERHTAESYNDLLALVRKLCI